MPANRTGYYVGADFALCTGTPLNSQRQCRCWFVALNKNNVGLACENLLLGILEVNLNLGSCLVVSGRCLQNQCRLRFGLCSDP